MATHRFLIRAIPASAARRSFLRPQAARFYGASNGGNPSSNTKNPISSFPESGSVNTSRGKESRSADTPDSRSTQSPISPHERGNPSEAHEGEEETSFDSHIKNDPKEPAEVKRRNVEAAGQKPMGPEDRTG